MGRQRQINDIKRFEPIFGKWYVLQKIGQGSYGTVYKIYKVDGKKRVYSALKHIHIGPETSDEKLQEISDASHYYQRVFDDAMQRIKCVCSLKGKANILLIEEYAYFNSENGVSWDIFIRMELLIPISEHYAKYPPSEQDIQKLGIDICSALEVCENENIVHLDVKPSNIYINSSNNYMLGDFGISRIVKGDRIQTTAKIDQYGNIIPDNKSSPHFLTADIYSLGVMLYQYLNDNKAPYITNNNAPYTFSMRENAILQRLSGKTIPPPQHASPEFAKIILRAMALSPAERLLSTKDMKSALMGIKHISTIPLWAKETRVSHVLEDETELPEHDSQLRGVKVGKSKYVTGQTEGYNNSGHMLGFKISHVHRTRLSDAENKRIHRIINWILFTCLLSMIPLFIFLLLRWIFVVNVPIRNKLAMELLYLGLTLAIVSIRELIRYEPTKKQSIVFQPALWLIIVDLFLSAILFSVMTANELHLFTEPVQSTKMLLAAVILSGTSFILGTCIQYWEDD